MASSMTQRACPEPPKIGSSSPEFCDERLVDWLCTQTPELRFRRRRQINQILLTERFLTEQEATSWSGERIKNAETTKKDEVTRRNPSDLIEYWLR